MSKVLNVGGGMMEQRAVRLSHELWKQMMTQGYASGGIQCVEGLPEDARLVEAWTAGSVWKPDPVFVFESDDWEGKPPEQVLRFRGRDYLLFSPVFRTTDV